MKRKLFYLVIQLGVCLSLFLTAGVCIFYLRGNETKSFVVPNFINKNFINVYNEIQRLDLRVKLTHREYQELPSGLIISQSIPPGQIAKPRAYLRLVVNQPKPFLEMPDLYRANIKSAVSSLQRLPANGKVYSLTLLPIRKIRTNQFPHNTIIAQFPPAESLIGVNENVYLLAAIHDKTKYEQKNDQKISLQKKYLSRDKLFLWLGQNISIISHYFHLKKIDYRIRRLIPLRKGKKVGQIKRIARTKRKTYLLDVYYQIPEKKYPSDYEHIKIRLDEKGPCIIKSSPIYTDKDQEESNSFVFATQKHTIDEEIDILFYRQNSVRVTAKCGGESIYSKSFHPEKLG